MDLQLKGKTALITGASMGIGRAIANGLGAEGVQLAITARRQNLLEDVVGEVVAKGGPKPVIIAQDFMAADGPAKIAEAALKALGAIDILINNAGGSRPFSLHATEEQWEEAITLNFTRQRQMTSKIVDQMIVRKWGRIINITGKSEPTGVNGAFCAKAAMHSWAKGLSREVGPHGVTVNSIPPGQIISEQILKNYPPERRKHMSETEIPVGRFGEAEELANLVVFLASPRAAYITGTVIPVDGGQRRWQFCQTTGI